jgi:hypothetical protein
VCRALRACQRMRQCYYKSSNHQHRISHGPGPDSWCCVFCVAWRQGGGVPGPQSMSAEEFAKAQSAFNDSIPVFVDAIWKVSAYDIQVRLAAWSWG